MPSEAIWDDIEPDQSDADGGGSVHRGRPVSVRRTVGVFQVGRTAAGIYVPVQVSGYVSVGLSRAVYDDPLYRARARGISRDGRALQNWGCAGEGGLRGGRGDPDVVSGEARAARRAQ